jgi:hypothetical protein
MPPKKNLTRYWFGNIFSIQGNFKKRLENIVFREDTLMFKKIVSRSRSISFELLTFWTAVTEVALFLHYFVSHLV